MLSNDEIRARYFARGTRIDRHGNYVEEYRDQMEGRYGFCLLLHYHLINGMTDKKARERLTGFDLSPVEIDFLLKKTKDFINDVLQIDLDQVRTALTSTENYLYQEVNDLYPKLNAQYEADRFAPIVYKDHRFQADEKSRATMQGYISSGLEPSYWLTVNNDTIKPWTLEDTKALYAAIIARDAELHQEMGETKTKIRTLTENKDFTAIKQLAADENLN